MTYKLLLFLLSIVLIQGVTLAEAAHKSDDALVGYWVPAAPPRAHYTIDAHIDLSEGTLKGSEIIRLKNTSSRPMHRLALDWSLSKNQTVDITIKGKPVLILVDPEQTDHPSPILFQLPKPLPPGKKLELNLQFTYPLSSDKLTRWHPRLWWGFPTCDDFDVNIQVPPEYVLATSGRLDRKSGYYHAEGVRSFGLVGKDLEVIEKMAGDVLVRALHTSKGEECAQFLASTAVDVIQFYRERFGFYPYSSLTIIPGMDRPVGGYPVATSIVAVHGQERMSERPELHWRWIMVHEIGHQYWGEYVLEKDSPSWLWIGLGIYADREYVRARGLGLKKHRELMARYIGGVRKHFDTTVAIPPDYLEEIEFDFNNVVVHGKGYSIISALNCLLGHETFDRIYRRCLKEFAGRRLGAYDFQAVCEEESGQNLAWFFDQWVRSNRYLSYQVASHESTKQNGRYVSQVRVECLGTLKMPVPVVAYFEDSTQQRQFTDRLLDVNILSFESRAALKEVRLDPDGELALVVPPPSATGKELMTKLREIPWVGGGKQALDLFNKAQETKPADGDFWGVLGLKVYDGRYYSEALEAFRRSAELAEEGSIWSFTSMVWQGHILDILDRREEALQCYREALERDTGGTMQHGQYDMYINRQWAQKRLEKPFQPPSAEELELKQKLRQIPYVGAGKQALDLFNKAQEIKPVDDDFWGGLGLRLYDGKYYPEALEAFRRSAEIAEEGTTWSSISMVWRGHILDLLGRREEALQCYREGLKRYTGSMQHSQYDMYINRKWIQERLEKPFERE